ncbi:MAG: hypothetical protein ABIT76_08780 [Chthoniobacterales bacterium]
MTLTSARACHPIPLPPEDDAPAPNIKVATRLRAVGNDPQREYANRPGEVHPLANNVAALILFRKGWTKIERNEIKVTLEGEPLTFASRHSMTIATLNGTGQRVLWALNRRDPQFLHLLTADGAYIESIPAKGEAEWFSQDATSQEAIADVQAQTQRDLRRVRDLHQPDELAAAADARQNAATIHRLVQTFPLASTTEPASFEKADRMESAIGETDRLRKKVKSINPTEVARLDTERILAQRKSQPAPDESWI